MTAPTLDELRALIEQKAPFLGRGGRLSSGSDALDQMLSGGFPRGAVSVLEGVAGSGRMALVSKCLARATAEGHPVAWIDTHEAVYPPALAEAGVRMDRLLMVRGAHRRSIYAAEQVVLSGSFAVVVVAGVGEHLSPSAARRLQVASENAEVCTLMLLEAIHAGLVPGAALKLQVERHRDHIQVEVAKDRSGCATDRRIRVR